MSSVEYGSTAKRRIYSVAACLVPAFLSLALSITFASRLNSFQMFDRYNILFNDDCLCAIKEMGRCERDYNRFRHPNIRYFFGMPISALGAAASRFGADETAVRRDAVLLVSPIASFITVASLSAALSWIGLGPWRTLLVGLFTVAAFSHSFFSSIPTHFSLSATGTALTYLLYVSSRRSGRIAWLKWIGLGIFVTGVTTVNLFVWALFLATAVTKNNGDRVRRIVSRKVLVPVGLGSAAVLGLTIGVNTICSLAITGEAELFGHTSRATHDFVHWVHYRPWSLIRRAVIFVAGMPDTIAPRAVGVDTYASEGDYPFNFKMMLEGQGMNAAITWLSTAALIVAIGLGAMKHRRTYVGTELANLSLIVVAFFGLVYVVYGDDEPFLYSQQWTVSLVYLFAGMLFRAPTARTRSDLAPFLMIASWTAVGTWSAWEFIFEILQRYAPN